MTKADLAKELYERQSPWLSGKEAFSIVELIFETLKNTLAEEETIKLSRFGTFLVRKRGAKKGRNLMTG